MHPQLYLRVLNTTRNRRTGLIIALKLQKLKSGILENLDTH